MAALAWFLARTATKKSAVPPILLMAAAGFYKHNIIAVPVTALLWLAMHDRRRAAVALAAGAGAAALGLALCYLVYGDIFFANLLTPRPYSVMRALKGLGRLQWILPALVLWGIWVAAEPKREAARFTMLFVAVAFVAFVVQWSGEAILDNAQFDLVIATAVGLGLAFDRAGATAFGRRFGEGAARARRRPCRCGAACGDAPHRAGAGAVRSGLSCAIFREQRRRARGRGAHRASSGAGRVRLQGGVPACGQAVCL